MEVKCRECRSHPNEVVMHYFDLATGKLVNTRRFLSVRELKFTKDKERRERQLLRSVQ